MVSVCTLAMICMTLDLTGVTRRTDTCQKGCDECAMHTDGDAPAAWKLNGFTLCLWKEVFLWHTDEQGGGFIVYDWTWRWVSGTYLNKEMGLWYVPGHGGEFIVHGGTLRWVYGISLNTEMGLWYTDDKGGGFVIYGWAGRWIYGAWMNMEVDLWHVDECGGGFRVYGWTWS